MQRTIAEVQSNPMAFDCHWLPQWTYIDSHRAGERACGNILHFERLDSDLLRLMQARGICVRLTGRKKLQSDCRLGRDDLDSASKRLLEQLYKQDFHRFGYTMAS
jgi:hypothetical protein